MHQSVMDFVLENMHRYGWHDVERILEVGSYNVNGTVRHDFAPEEYIGIDIAEGPCVDIVMSSHRLQRRFGWGAFDLVLCLEMLEHDRAPWTTVREMLKVCRPGGWVCAEHAEVQEASAPEVFVRQGSFTHVADHRDLTDRPRFVTARRGGRMGA